jgi:hypothetical protein
MTQIKDQSQVILSAALDLSAPYQRRISAAAADIFSDSQEEIRSLEIDLLQILSDFPTVI